MHFIVVIEWDGNKPPTRWYNRLRELNIAIRGDKSISPMKRRAFSGKEGVGTVPQEGTIITQSESLARSLAGLASSLDAKSVKIGQSDLIDMFVTTDDAKIMQSIENVLGKRGRRSPELFDWAVTCLEECRTYMVHQKKYVICCPMCSATRIKKYKGDALDLVVPSVEDVKSHYEAWLRHRFSNGEYSIPLETANATPADTDVVVDDLNLIHEKLSVKAIDDAKEFHKLVAKLPRREAFEVLDATFAARAYFTKDARKERRIRVVTELLEKGVGALEVSLIEKQKADLLDIGMVFGTENTVEMFLVTRK